MILLVWRKCLFLLLLLPIILTALDPEWHTLHQSDYHIEPHRVELKWTNTTYFNMTQFELIKINRTYHRVLNASGYLLKDISKNFKIYGQVFKRSVTEYKPFPVSGYMNVCREYDRNSFNVKEVVKKYTNAHPCPQKKGYFYVKHADYDESRFPPFIPKGDYKLYVKLFHNEDLLGIVEAYGSVLNINK